MQTTMEKEEEKIRTETAGKDEKEGIYYKIIKYKIQPFFFPFDICGVKTIFGELTYDYRRFAF